MGVQERRVRERSMLKSRREREILEAAEKLFIQKGFQKTTIADIAKSCELTNGALYLYFKSKSEIILIIMTRISLLFGDYLEENERLEASGLERVKSLFNVYNKTFSEYQYYHILDAQFNILFDQKYPDSPYLMNYFEANRRILSIFANAFKVGLSDKSIKLPYFTGADSGVKAARMFLNVINSYVEKLTLRQLLMEREQEVNMTTELEDFINYLVETLR